MRALLLLLTILSGLTSLSTSAIAQPYRLQPGDRVAITVWQDEKLNREVVVSPDGRISFPLAGHLQAAGSSLEALESSLRQRLQGLYTESLNITAALVGREEEEEEEEEGPIIYVTGQVRNPGQFVLKRQTTVLQAIALSGGLGPFAAKSRIQLRRRVEGGDTVLPFNFKEVERGHDLTQNYYLRDGDVVYVPERGLFR